MAKEQHPVDELLPDGDEPEELEDDQDSSEEGEPEESVEPEGETTDEGEGDGEEEEPPKRQQRRDKPTGQFRPGKVKPKQTEGNPTKGKPQQQPQTIPLATLIEERRQFQARLRALEEENGKLKAPNKEPEKPAEIVVPDYATDPAGHIDAKHKIALQKMEALEKNASEKAEAARKTAEQAAAQSHDTEFRGTLKSAEERFVAQNPDYYHALAHIRGIRINQLRLFDPTLTDEQIVQQIGSEELNLARSLAQQNRNPVETLYQLAQHYGYTPQKPGKTGKRQNELPQVQGGPAKLPPDQHLGGSGKDDPEDDGGSDEEFEDQFDVAFAELYGRSGQKRRRA